MEFSRERNVIHTGGDGRLDQTTRPEHIDAMVAAMCRSRRIVLHFHGGLVSEDDGFAGAERLHKTYVAAGAYPVFFVWRSGIMEQVTGNVTELAEEELFKRLLAKLMKYAVGKVAQTGGDRAAGALPAPQEMAVNRELVRRQRDEEPYAQLEVPGDLTPVSDDERAQLETEVAEDPAIQNELAAVLAWHTAETGRGARGVYAVAPHPTKMSRDVLDELAVKDEGARGIGAALVLGAKVARALVRVVARFRAGRAHGVYPTVLEELLREFYLAEVGGVVWNLMKKDTLDAFVDADPPRGGSYLLGRLGAQLHGGTPGQQLPEITLVGHSTGAVYINHLIGAVQRRRTEFPDGFHFRNVAFLAPACTHENFAQALRADLIGRFRLFTMTDEAERADRLVGPLYPRSLLHLIAGALERDGNGDSAYRTITGMARYLDGDGDDAALGAVRAYVKAEAARVVLSPNAAGAPPGQQAGARSHSAFDEDPLVLASLTTMIQGGL